MDMDGKRFMVQGSWQAWGRRRRGGGGGAALGPAGVALKCVGPLLVVWEPYRYR